MQEIDGGVTIKLCTPSSEDEGEGTVLIEIFDRSSLKVFAYIRMTSTEFTTALTGRFRTECQIMVDELDKVGLVHEHKTFEFCIGYEYDTGLPVNMKEEAIRIAKRECPKGWVPDENYSSQESFFMKYDLQWARTVIRRWVKKDA